MKIVITGSESFVGKALISQLKNDENFELIGLDAINAKPTDYEFHKIDIRNKEIHRFIPEEADALIHLAALSRDPDCKGKAYECFDVNVLGTLNLVNVAAQKNVKQFIFASSEWVYETFHGDEEKDENSFIDISKHTSEYALSKLVSEANLRQRYKQSFCPVTILRFGIIYGPRKQNWAAVEAIASAVKNNSEVKVGSLKNSRRFVHVNDIAYGIKKAIGLDGFHILNLTGDKLISLNEIIKKSEILFEKSAKVIETNPSQINIRNPSNRRAKKILNWKPMISLEDGLKTIQDFV